MGLAITKSLVNMLQGKINVQSSYGKWSIFVVNIPQKISEEKVNEIKEYNYKREAKKQEQEEEINKREDAKRILLVDDNELNVKVAKKILTELPYEIDICYSGKECIEKVKSNNYDLILMDIMMSELSGEDTFKELQKINNFNTPVIALTADAVAGAEDKYISEGFIEYLAKPFKKEELIEKINKVLNNKEKMRVEDAPEGSCNSGTRC